MNARESLAEEHAVHQAAVRTLDGTRQATATARQFAAELEREVAKLAETIDGTASARAAELRETIRAGRAPAIVEAPDLPRTAAKRIDAENRLMAAREALAVFEREEGEASAAVDAAQKRVDAAADAVVVAEVEAAAARVIALEQEAIGPRSIVGTQMGFVFTVMRAPVSASVLHVVHKNDASPMSTVNEKEWRAAAAASARLQAFRAALRSDPEAAL